MSFNKLSIVNDCLGLTGNLLCNAEEDGSDEWRVASIAYEAAILDLLGAHDWKFATSITHLTRAGDSPDTDYKDAFDKPVNSLGLAWVRVAGMDVDWKIVGNKVLVTANNAEVTAKVVLQPGPEGLSPLFVKALRSFVRAGCFGGLNEDHPQARAEREEGEAYIQQARTRSDQEQRPRKGYRGTWLRNRSRGEAPKPW